MAVFFGTTVKSMKVDCDPRSVSMMSGHRKTVTDKCCFRP